MKKASKRLITLSLAFMLIFGNLIPRLSHIHAEASQDSVKVETSTSKNAEIEKQEINATSDKTDKKAEYKAESKADDLANMIQPKTEVAERGATVNAGQNIDYEFDMRWANGVSSDVKDYHYTDESKKTLAFTPIDNHQKTATLAYSLKLKNDANTVIPKGAIKIKVPAYIFKDWNDGDKTRANYDGYLPVLKWQIPKAPETSTVSDFNYVDNGDGTLTLSNFKTISGSSTLSFEQAFTFVPSFVKLNKDKDGEETGTVKEKVKASLSIDAKTPINEEKELGISLHSENTPTKISLKQANLDEYKGVYFDWQDNWGERPADADDYFYVIWYADIQRGSYPKIPFDYEINQEDDGVGGKIVGIKKDTSYEKNTGFNEQRYMDYYTDYSYKDIAKGDEGLFKQTGLWHEYRNRRVAFPTLYGFYNSYTGHSGNYHYARFSILKKYPKSIIEAEKKKGTDLAKDGFKLPNKISVTDTLRNGVVKKSEIVSADADIHIHEYKGKNNIWKWDSQNSTGGLSNVAGGQDFLLQDLDVKLISSYLGKSTFTIHTTTSASEEPTLENGKAKSKPYTSTIEDGNLYHSTGFKNYDVSYSNQSQFFEKLKDGDYSYKSVYFELKEFDAKKTDGGWMKITNPSKDYEHFKPIDIFVRYGGGNSYTKLGQITFDKNGKQNYLSEDGKTEIKNVTADNPVVFPKNVVNIKYSHTSTFFESDLYARPTLMLHPTDNLKKLIQDDKKKINRYFTYLSSDAKLTVSTDGGKTVDSNTTGQPMKRTTKTINPIMYTTHVDKIANTLADDVKDGKQTLSVSAYIGNLMNLWDSGNPDFEYIDKYTAKKLAFYDLLPAGTYVEPNSIIVHGGYWWWGINKNSIVDKSAYTVEYKENWEGSGQTMMIVTVDFPQSIREFYKISANHGSKFYIHYKLVNTYNNISDRGNSVINTIGIKNLSDDVNFKSNAKASNVAKKDLYKNLIGDEYDKWNLVQTTMNYNTVTVKQAGVVKKAANDHDNQLKEKTKVFPGNKYLYNLAYTMSSDTRADQIIMYDILENGNDKEKSEWQGKLDWVDLNALKQKPAYNHPGETLEPVLYISKLAPDKIKLDVDDSSVWEKVEADKLSEINKISGIKAIAIDCRKTNKGNPFILDRGMGLQAEVHMVAPVEKEIIGKTAVNKTDIQARTFNGSEANTTNKANLYEASAKVLAKKLDISFTKASDILTGTKENPALIENKVGDSIKYTLSIINNDMDLDVRNIAMEDVIPEGLTPDLDNILVTAPAFKLDKAKLSGLAQAGVKKTGQKLDFSIGSLPAGESIIFEIPTKIENEFIRTTLFDNTAKITKVENKEREIISNTTHHKAVKQYKLNYVVKADKNHGIPANSQTPDEVTGIEYDETKTLAKSLKTTEIVDNAGVKGVWTFKGWAEKADDIDNSIIDKVKILKDTTVYGQWEFNPTQDITIEKKWEDAKDGTGKILKKASPEDITIELYQNDKKIKEKKLTVQLAWKHTFENLPVAEKEGANPYKYTVKEVGVDKNNKIKLSNSWYKANIQGDADKGFTITNKVLADMIPMEPPTRTVKVTKEWLNDKKTAMPLDKIKDNKITVELHRDGKPTGKTAELNAATNWTASFDKLPVSKTVGSQAYTYTIAEKGVSTDKEITLNGLSYKSEVSGNQKDGFKLSNTLINPKISVSGEKLWKDKDDQDGIRPEKITVNLYANDKFTGKSFEATKDGKWKYSFENLPTYDEKGDRLSYTVKEDEVKDYTSEISEAKIDQAGNIVYDIVNSHKPLERSIQVKKIWVDDNNKKELRPDEIKVKLIADGNLENSAGTLTIKADENGKWEAEFKNLPVNNKGKEIDYTVIEESVKNYKEVVTGTMQDGFTITNTIEGKKSIGITKKWIGRSTDFIEVVMLKDGKEYKKAKITKANNWQYTFADIDVYDNKDGHEYQYNVAEVAIEGYESKIEKVADGSYRVINKEILRKKSALPKTGDSSNLALYGTLMGLSGLPLIAVGIRKRRKES